MSKQQTEIGSCPAHWEVVKLNTVAELKHGYQFRTHDFTEQGVKVFKITQIQDDGSIDLSSCSYIDSSRLQSFEKYVINNGDILMALSGATIGKIARFKSDEVVLQNYRVGNFIPTDEQKLNKDYFYYFLTTENTYYQILANQNQSAQENVGKEDIHNMFVFLPPPTEQTAIASVLSSLDDKIDLLNRQNTTLKKMAESLFRQWFVEDAKEEWEELPLQVLGKIICGKTPSKKVVDYFNGNIPFIKIPDMHGKTFVFDTEDSLTEEGMNSQNNKTIPPKSICVSCIATVGLVVMNAKTSQTNQQINSIIPGKEIYRYFIYLKMISMKDDLLAMASGGTATDNLNTGNFSKIGIQMPNDDELTVFHDTVNPLFEKIYTNQTQIRTLTQIRDSLLPKLMTGEATVE